MNIDDLLDDIFKIENGKLYKCAAGNTWKECPVKILSTTDSENWNKLVEEVAGIDSGL